MNDDGGIRFEETGAGTPTGRWLRRFWHPVLLGRELAAGRAMPVRVLGQELTIFRDESGGVHAVGPRCPHRGVALSIGRVEGACLRCRYHGWMFDASGQCVEQPAERPGFAHKVRVATFPVEEYVGLIFCYLGDAPAPPLPRFPQLDGERPRLTLSDLRGTNFFQDLENVIDDVHQRYVHAASFYQDEEYAHDMPELSAEETSYGLVQRSRFANGHTRTLMLLMPNCVYFRTGASRLRGLDGLLWIVPVDDTSHKIIYAVTAVDVPMPPAPGSDAPREKLTPPRDEVAAVLSGRKRFEDIGARPDRILLEDTIILEAQGVTQDRANQWLAKSDAAIILLRKLWAREVNAYMSGEPLTPFVFPPSLRPT